MKITISEAGALNKYHEKFCVFVKTSPADVDKYRLRIYTLPYNFIWISLGQNGNPVKIRSGPATVIGTKPQ
jgi:hypothetical protein